MLVVLLGGFTAFAPLSMDLYLPGFPELATELATSQALGACLFAGGILVTPLLALGGEGSAVPIAAVVAGGALAALLATVVLTRARGRPLEPVAPRSRDQRT